MFQYCRICSGKLIIYNEVFDDRYGYSGYFDILKCNSCDHKVLKVEFSQNQLIRLYTDYYPRSTFDFTNLEPSRDPNGFCAWLNGVSSSAYCWVPENVRVLDIGCGFGQTLGYHKARGCEVYGVEADENIRPVADKYGFNVHVGLFDPEQYEPDFFDCVTLDQVIEHVTDPIETLRGIAYVLKPGGVAILSTPNANGWVAKLFGRRWINWHAPYHLQHFSQESMRVVAEKTGLKIEQIRTLTSSEWLHYQWIHALNCPNMGDPSQFWSPKATRGLRIKLIQGILTLFHRTKINHILTRLSDVLGFGDNYLFFMRKL
jgi:2-polyprenyl-3-methyl-5-hydroxy-6-metoxy-1,4-benzoquinol methylase